MRVEIRIWGRWEKGPGRKDIHCIFLIRKVDVPKMFELRGLMARVQLNKTE